MRLEDEQYEYIKSTVSDTFIEYGIKSAPISAFEMATKMGIKVIPYSALGKEKESYLMKRSGDGFLAEYDDHTWKLYYNDHCQSYGRINHTIMHEVGHYALGHIKEGDEEEAEAEFFAKYALAPPPLIHNMVENISPFSIMKKFDISYAAACYAYKYYNSWLQYGQREYTGYERKILSQFSIA